MATRRRPHPFRQALDFTRSYWGKKGEIARLIRLEKQYGTLLLLLPTLWSLFVASEGRPTLKHLAIFILGAFLMRSAGCVANDMADRRFDAKVERTKGRPLASNRLTMKEAFATLVLLLTLSFLLVLMLNPLTILLSFAALLVALLYPFAKRVTHLPQVVLGIAFSWGVIMAWTAVRNTLSVTPFLILLANLFWATGYDTIYALMDRDDDLQIGVRSTATLFGAQSWFAVSLFFALVVLFLTLAGRRLQMAPVYYLTLGGIGLFFAYQGIQLRKPLSRTALFSLFRSHVWVGLTVLIGITLHYHLFD
ncbi:MAG: 4-hydroxybenzoate octaprenyltransferase [Nitrospiria bacterium]